MAAASLPRLLGAAAVLTVAACTESPREAPPSSGNTAPAAIAPDTAVSSTPPAAGLAALRTRANSEEDCNAERAAPFVGRRAEPRTRAELAAVVAPVTAIRWVGPGDATTEDYNPQRLNVMLDVDGIIRSAHCG